VFVKAILQAETATLHGLVFQPLEEGIVWSPHYFFVKPPVTHALHRHDRSLGLRGLNIEKPGEGMTSVVLT
jgi:hypothetical protein